MIKERIIRDLEQVVVPYDDFIIQIEKYNKEEYSFHVGSDSQQFYDKISIVTSICYHHKMKGAGAFYIKDKIKKDRLPTLRSRMMAEAYRSLEVAFIVQKLVSSKISVHLDIGSDPLLNKSSAYKNELTNLVIGQGFPVYIKPYSWASSSVADWFTKT